MKIFLLMTIALLFTNCTLTATKDDIVKYNYNFIDTLNNKKKYHDEAPVKGKILYNHSATSLDYFEFRKNIVLTIFKNYEIKKMNPGKTFAITKKNGLLNGSEIVDYITEDGFSIICEIGIQDTRAFGRLQYIDCVKKTIAK
jgi:hypothetical protein